MPEIQLAGSEREPVIKVHGGARPLVPVGQIILVFVVLEQATVVEHVVPHGP